MDVLLIIFLLFIVVFCFILLVRLFLTIAVDRAYKNLKKLKELATKSSASKKEYIKEEEEIFLEKIEIPRAHSQRKAEFKAKQAGMNLGNGQYEVMDSKEQKQEMEDVNIVDIVKPVGFWTSMILGQKLTYLVHSAQIINKREDKGFWASMIEAKEKAAGREHSRGR